MYYVYMMTNWNNRVLYIGVTGNLEKRIYEHITKVFPGFTNKYNVNKLVYYEEFLHINQAIDREKQLKHWVRIKKNELINRFNPDWEDLSRKFLE